MWSELAYIILTTILREVCCFSSLPSRDGNLELERIPSGLCTVATTNRRSNLNPLPSTLYSFIHLCTVYHVPGAGLGTRGLCLGCGPRLQGAHTAQEESFLWAILSNATPFFSWL